MGQIQADGLVQREPLNRGMFVWLLIDRSYAAHQRQQGELFAGVHDPANRRHAVDRRDMSDYRRPCTDAFGGRFLHKGIA